MIKYSFDTLCRVIKPKEIIGKSYFRIPRSFSIDSRTIKPDQGYIAIKGTIHDGHDFISQSTGRGVRVVICRYLPEAGTEKTCFLLVRDTSKALKRICRFIVSASPALSFSVTGSVGKTTTKEMVAFLFSHKGRVHKNSRTENNLLGVCKTVLNLDQGHDFLVTELGTNAPGEIKELASIVKPDVGVITSVKPVHIQGLRSLSAIAEEKKALLQSGKNMLAILNRDDPFLRGLDLKGPVYWFGMSRAADLYARSIDRGPGVSRFKVNGRYPLCLNTAASFFIYNALAAIAAAESIGMSIEQSCRLLSGFSAFPAMRMEMVRRRKTCFINDAYNSNPFAAREALKVIGGFPGPRIAVLGDMRELGKKSVYYHRQLAGELLKYEFSHIITLGEETRATHERLRELGCANAFHFDDYRKVISFLRAVPDIGGSCVLVKGSRALAMERIIEEF